TESVLLAFIGGTLGLALAYAGLGAILRVSPGIPRLQETTIDLNVLSVTLCASIFTGILFGIAPALRTSKTDEIAEVLKSSAKSSDGRDQNFLRSLLIVGECSLALMLLVTAGLLIRSFVQLGKVDLGFNPERVLTGWIMLPATKYAEPARQTQFV